jgi:uncharacterized delta-60 repeat protein
MKVLATLARFRIFFAFVAVSAMCIFFAVAVTAAPGDLDTTFDGDGLVTTDFNGSDIAREVAIQADGKIIAVGEDGTSDFALARYNTDGSLDTTFDGDGKVTTDFSGNDGAYGVAIQSDGKIVAVGRNGPQDFALARYNTDGSLDTSFDGDGKVTTDFSGGDLAFDVAIQSDGKIVVAGKDGAADFTLARYNTDGSLDTTFDGDGKVTLNFNGIADTAYGVAIQSDGKIVAAGQNTTPNFALARYNTDGSLDATFDGDGAVVTGFSGDDLALSVAIQSDGKIVAVGRDGSQDFALARYNTDGSLDTSFDSDGKVTTSFTAGDDLAFAVAIQSDGKIVAAGTDSSQDFALARYNTDGSLDTSFGTAGGLTTSFTVGDDIGRGVAIQADGKIVVVGVDGNEDFAIARYIVNSPPVANAGPNQSVSVSQTVTLDGSGSTDVDVDPLTYAWSFVSVPAGSTATLSDPKAVMPTFVADEEGTYTVQLIVNDGSEDSASDTVTITATQAPANKGGGGGGGGGGCFIATAAY